MSANNSSCEKVILVKDICINTEEHTVYKSKEIIELTPKEYDILCLLATNKGRVYSTKMIYEMIWKDSFMENDNSVITHIRNLREKIGRANYDRLAKIINELCQEYKQENWIKAAELFDKCGKNIETIVAYIVEYCCNGIDRMDKVPQLFLENADYAREAYQLIQDTKK